MSKQQGPQRILLSGRVKSLKDPDSLGRVQVDLPGFDATVTLPWIRLVSPYASKDFGQVILPEEGDEVMVLQGAGNSVDQMVCLGSVYHGKAKPPYANADGKNDQKMLRTRSGHELIFDDHQGGEKITLRTPDGKLCLEMDHAAGAVTITSAQQVNIDCPSGKVKVTCANAEISATGAVKVKGAGQVEVSSGGSVSVKAPNISLAGNVSLG